ncbi:MAG TPA: ABC-type transport auxiliary lipoprotein family protein [Nitrospira sp.]|jgi:cholesterol transport system auxiliary component|nr:ABC-type transport auxiliary lipoprotein family protein [Nitrospira sp.]
MKYRLVHMALAVLVITTAGCLSPRTGSSEIHIYQLSLDGWSGEARPGKREGPVLLVSQPQAEPGFETPRMVYVKRPYELEYYAVNQWADTPVRMFAQLMVQVLNQHDGWRAVIPLPSSIRGDYRLDTHGFLLQQEFLQQPSRVRVMVRTQLIDLRESTIISARAFEVVENAASENPYGGVQAANRAVAELLDRIGSWLRQCVQHSPECGR